MEKHNKILQQIGCPALYYVCFSKYVLLNIGWYLSSSIQNISFSDAKHCFSTLCILNITEIIVRDTTKKDYMKLLTVSVWYTMM